MNLNFADLQQQLPGQELSWLQQLRQDAFSYFEKKGFPTRFDEDWKYTKTKSLIKEFENLEIKSKKVTSDVTVNFLDKDDYFVLFVDGQFVSSRLPTDAGVNILSLKEAFKQKPTWLETYISNNQLPHSLIALNQALMSDGIVIHVAKNVSLDRPIYCLFMHESTNAMHYNRHIILTEQNSSVQIVEKYFSHDAKAIYFANHVTDCYASENAHIEHIKIIEEAINSFHFSHLTIHQQKSSCVKSNVFTISGNWIRSDIDANLNAVDVDVELNGLFIAKGQQQVDHHTTIHHFKPQGRSIENYKGIIDEEAIATFNGKVIVAQDAQKTNATQSSKNLLLSKHAEINTKPELQIYADDVKCAHGATVGQLDENSLFYLCSRGLPYNYAKKLLLSGFAMEQIDKINIPSLKQHLQQSLELLHDL